MDKFFYCFLAILFFLLQVSLFGNGFFILGNINFLLAGLVILIIVSYPAAVFLFGFVSGLFLDLYSNLPFGIYLLIFLILAIAGEFLFYNFFTNRSLYSLLSLGALLIVAYNLLFILLFGLFYVFGFIDQWLALIKFNSIFWELLGTLVFLSLVYVLINKISKIFKPIFLS